jgi:hypothetical protein
MNYGRHHGLFGQAAETVHVKLTRRNPMFRKLTVVLCLISFCPAAVGAQELTGVAGAQMVADMTSGQNKPSKELNLSLPVNKYPADKLASAENPISSDAVKVDAPKMQKSSGVSLKEWAEIHWGNNRWVWWVGAAAALVALHVFVFQDHK